MSVLLPRPCVGRSLLEESAALGCFSQVMFRKGKALSMKGDYEEAEEFLAAAAEMDSNIEAEAKAASVSNKQRAKAAAAKQKQQFSNFFGKV